MAKLWDDAQMSMRENKHLKAEKALLTILKIDEKNAAAYNRLGILYAKQKEFDDAIDCFEIATTIDKSASSLHNLGLIYFETEQYDKARVAFKHALDMDDALAARYIAYAKVLERLNKPEEMLLALEKAVDIEQNKETLTLLLKGYQNNGKEQEAEKTQHRLETLIQKSGNSKVTKRPAKAVV